MIILYVDPSGIVHEVPGLELADKAHKALMKFTVRLPIRACRVPHLPKGSKDSCFQAFGPQKTILSKP